MDSTTTESETEQINDLPSQTFKLELFPDSLVTLALFENVANIAELKDMLMQRKIEAALLTATMLVSPFHILVAVNKALHAHATGHAKTRTVTAEVIVSLSPSSYRRDAFQTFTMTPGDQAVVAVVLDDHDGSQMKNIAQQVKGTCVPLDQMSNHIDVEKVRKKYKVTDAELAIGSLQDAVVCKIATNDVS